MKKSILSVLAAATFVVATGTSFAPSTAQAGGIRLGFGVPLGAFVAHSIAQDSYRREREYERRQYRAEESARVRAARRAEKVRAAQLAKAEARADAVKAEARRELAKLNKAKEAQETASIEPKADKVAAVTPAATEEVKVKEPVTTVASTSTKETAEPETTADEPKSSGKKECKKFIPAVGVTISVGC